MLSLENSNSRGFGFVETMDNIRSTEWLLLMICLLHTIVAPYTKVEESFNVQAIHDFLYHRLNFDEYDHHQFPGVVPRTFMGALAVSVPLLPFASFFKWRNIEKYWMLLIARFVLGGSVLLAFCQFARQVEKKFGRETGGFLRLIVATQFHFMFYCSRPLPNTFALVAVLWTYQKILDERWICAAQIATISTLLFRCELVLLYACFFINQIMKRRIALLGWHGAIVRCLFCALLTLGISVPIDSFLWRRWLWPEGEVWWFNVVLNRSHEYGVLPFFWYFYSAIPRALMMTFILIPVGVFFDHRLMPVLAPALCYIFLYSFLPHKELRFIIYTFPILNIPAAVLCAKLWINRWKSSFRMFIAVAVSLHLVVNVMGAFIFLYASSRNYPGGEALSFLQFNRFK